MFLSWIHISAVPGARSNKKVIKQWSPI